MHKDDKRISLSRSQFIGSLMVVALITGLLVFGFFGVYGDSADGGNADGDVITSAENYDELVRAVRLTLQKHVDSSIEPEQMIEGAIDGALKGTGDPHSAYFDAEAMKEFQESVTHGEYTGIGVSVLKVEEYVTVVTVFEGGPAETTSFEGAAPDDPVGLKSGDRIVSVDGTDVVGMPADQVATMIKGPEGETVRVGIDRKTEQGRWKTLIFELERATVEIPTADHEIIEDDIGVLVISGFTSHTAEQVEEHLDELLDAGVSGIILDLRNNPGGTVDACVKVADMFLGEGAVVTTVNREGDEEVMNSHEPGFDLPLVVLVNRYSASASEILAGALRDRKDVALVGEKTFGKGSVQRIFYLDRDQPTGMKITVSRYLTPSGYSIEEEGGLTPDYEVQMEGSELLVGDPDRDPQLRRAIDVLKAVKPR